MAPLALPKLTTLAHWPSTPTFQSTLRGGATIAQPYARHNTIAPAHRTGEKGRSFL